MRDWQAVHADDSIQYGPVPPLNVPQQEEPAWIKFLRELLEPIGKALGMSWPVLQWVLIAVGLALALYAAWRLSEPWRERLRDPEPEAAEPGWSPDRDAALALLEDADRLAAEGRYDEAAHLLLQRSVHHIAAERPEWLTPSSTSREIGRITGLPWRAKEAFGLIAREVERSLFALQELGADDWQRARTAYADFALADLRRGG